MWMSSENVNMILQLFGYETKPTENVLAEKSVDNSMTWQPIQQRQKQHWHSRDQSHAAGRTKNSMITRAIKHDMPDSQEVAHVYNVYQYYYYKMLFACCLYIV